MSVDPGGLCPSERPTGNGCAIVRGTLERCASELARDAEKTRDTAAGFSDAIDAAVDSFLRKTGWQGLDAPSIVVEFARFAKQGMEPSIDDLKSEAKERAAEKSSRHIDQSADRGKTDPER